MSRLRTGIVFAAALTACGGHVDQDGDDLQEVDLRSVHVDAGCSGPEVTLRADYRNPTSAPKAWQLDGGRFELAESGVWQLAFGPSGSGVVLPDHRVTIEHSSLPGGGPPKITDDCYQLCDEPWTLLLTWSTDGQVAQSGDSGSVDCNP